MILGLDVSTTTIGYCVLSEDGKIKLIGSIDLSKFDDQMQKAQHSKAIIETLPKEIDKVVIEKSLMAFAAGASSAKTLHTLASFNGIISWICYEVFDIKPRYISATSARTVLGIKVPKKTKAKEAVVSYILSTESSYKPELTKTGSMKKQFYDIADAIIVARALEKMNGQQDI